MNPNPTGAAEGNTPDGRTEDVRPASSIRLPPGVPATDVARLALIVALTNHALTEPVALALLGLLPPDVVDTAARAVARRIAEPEEAPPAPTAARAARDELADRWTARLRDGGRAELEAAIEALPAPRVVEVPVERVFVAVRGPEGNVEGVGPTPELAQRAAYRMWVDLILTPRNLADEERPVDADVVELLRSDLADLVVVPLDLPPGLVHVLDTLAGVHLGGVR